MATIIVGGGIIGLSTAFYLSKQDPNRKIDIIDSSPSLFLSASGYAGGFLAKDWFSQDVAELGELSFRLHRELADENDGARKWGYSQSIAYSLAIDGSGVSGKRTRKQDRKHYWLGADSSRAETAFAFGPEDVQIEHEPSNREMLNPDGSPAWLTRQEGGSLEVISSEDGCAQVEPREFCEWLLEECSKRGVRIHLGSQPLKLNKNIHGRVDAITIKKDAGQQVLPCSNLVIAAGAWTPRVFKTLFPDSRSKIRISPLAGYSIVVRSPRYSRPIVDTGKHKTRSEAYGLCHSVFSGPSGDWTYAPEAISRMTKAGRVNHVFHTRCIWRQ